MVVQNFFRVTLMTFAAALVMIACNLLYTQVTGVYLFASSNLPAAAFLGLHLLMTDPSTSPRSNVGRTLFGAGYGLGYVIAFEVLAIILAIRLLPILPAHQPAMRSAP
jgi:Na+-translocating ferredoxin:NAD+ oxidoreductase RnfD subunit